MKLEAPWPKPRREDCYFYHSFDLPNGEVINGSWDLRGKFSEYVGGVDVRDKTVFDLGTATGFLAFNAEQNGAKRVVGLELDELSSSDRIPFKNTPYFKNKREWSIAEQAGLDRQKRAFWYIWHSLNSSVEAFYGSVEDLLSIDERFDIVFAGAIIEHLSDPITAIGACCRLSRETVVIGFTPAYDTDDEFMKPIQGWMNPQHDYSWWVLSRGLYNRVFDNMGFRVEYRPCSIVRDGVLIPRLTMVARRIDPTGM